MLQYVVYQENPYNISTMYSTALLFMVTVQYSGGDSLPHLKLSDLGHWKAIQVWLAKPVLLKEMR